MTRLIAAAVLFALSAAASAVNIPDPPTLDVKSYALLDFDSGELLASFNPDQRVEPASITKVMTTYIAFDEIRKGHLHFDDDVLISEKAWHEGIDSSESRMFVQVGSRVKVSDILRGIIIASGNDASVAMAEHIAGNESAFADMMNEYAKQLGLKDTHFADASGMPNEQHYTTAHDLVKLGQALIRDFPEDYKIYSERSFKYGIDHPQENRNGLLAKDPSVDGIKTGHTNSAGYCLLASAKRENRRLISAVMGAPCWNCREESSLALLNYGFHFFETDSFFGPDAPAATGVAVWKGAQDQVSIGTLEPIGLALPRDSKSRLVVAQKLNTPLIAPLAVGQPVGEATISLDGKPLKTVQLVALKAVDSGSWWRRLVDQIRLWLHWV